MNHKTWSLRLLSITLLLGMIFTLPLTALAVGGSACSQEDKQKIWDFLMEITENNPVGAAAIMGNLYEESHLNTTEVENGAELPDGITESDYTTAVDLGDYQKFSTDRIGYGIAQWTDPNRKANLLKLAKEQEQSIGSLEIQLKHVAAELEAFNMMYRLKHFNSIREASDYVLLNFENPNIQDESVKNDRAERGRRFYREFYERPSSQQPELTQEQFDVINVAMHSEEYGIQAKRGYCMAWVADVFEAAGQPTKLSTSAVAAATRDGVSEDFSDIPVGAVVFGHSTSRYGHIGIYVGDGMVYHNIGSVAADPLEAWMDTYHGFCWGWLYGKDLTEGGCSE